MTGKTTEKTTVQPADSEKGTILSAAQKKQLIKQRLKEKRARKVPQSVQQTITYEAMYKDGICKVDATHYNKCIRFGDINYQLAQNEDKSATFEFWCDFYNYFDSSISLQLSCVNQYASRSELEGSISIPRRDDDQEEIRQEYEEILKSQMEKWKKLVIQ